MTRRSIRWQLQWWYGLFFSGVVVCLLLLYYSNQERIRRAAGIIQLQVELQQILPALMPPYVGGPNKKAGHETPMAHGRRKLNDFVARGGFARLWTPDRTLYKKYGVSNYTSPPPEMIGAQPGIAARFHQHRYEVVLTHPSGTAFMIGIDEDNLDEGIPSMSVPQLVLIGLGTIGVGMLGGWLISGRALRPLRTMSETASRIAEGHHDERIELATAPTELTALARALNHSYDSLNELLVRLRQFTADASHELRTPVSVVLAQSSSALARDHDSDEYRAALEACQRTARRMKRLVTDLLDLSQLDQGRYALECSPTDLRQLIEAAVESARALSSAHPIRLDLPATPCMLSVDPDRMFRVLINLLTNAIQHNPDGCDIEVGLHAAPGEISIEIADNGVGFDMDAHRQLFERFYRIDQSRSRAHGGSGLGLSIARAIVEAHGGTLTVAAQCAEGATFTIRLPLALDAGTIT